MTESINHPVPPINSQKREYRIEVLDHQFLFARWQELQAILYRVFGDSAFNDRFTRNRPAEHTWEIINKPYQQGIKHVIALDSENEILGAFLVIPTCNPTQKEDCDLGWMFTIELYPRFRLEVIDSIINTVHEVTQEAGFKRIITEMGTEAGARLLAKKYGYIHTPTGDKQNRWTKEFY